jgi:drug/metabolite transporter (DMT)-like permease
MKQISKRMWAGVIAVLLAAPMMPAAFAFRGAPDPEPTKPWLQWIVTLLMVGACAAIMFKNAKRSHQD